MEQVQKKTAAGSRTRSIAFVALTVAITAVSAWVTVPLGPVPFTLQIFAVAFMVLVLQPKEAVAAVTAYLVLGAVGVPVFSGMRGGIGVLAGATGGFLWGYLLGVGLAVAVRFGLKAVLARDGQAKGARAFAIDFLTGLVFLAVAYVCGWAQLMAVPSQPALRRSSWSTWRSWSRRSSALAPSTPPWGVAHKRYRITQAQ